MGQVRGFIWTPICTATFDVETGFMFFVLYLFVAAKVAMSCVVFSRGYCVVCWICVLFGWIKFFNWFLHKPPPPKNLIITFNLNVSLFMFEEVGLPINLLKFDSYIAYFELKCRCLLSVNQTKPTPIIVLMTNQPQPSFASPCLQDSN